MESSHPSGEELIACSLQEDQYAFGALYKRYILSIYRLDANEDASGQSAPLEDSPGQHGETPGEGRDGEPSTDHLEGESGGEGAPHMDSQAEGDGTSDDPGQGSADDLDRDGSDEPGGDGKRKGK